MTDRDDEARLGGGYRAGSTSYLLGGGCTSDCNGHDQVAEAHRLLVGAVVNAPPSVRDRVFGLLAPGDLDTPIASDALGGWCFSRRCGPRLS